MKVSRAEIRDRKSRKMRPGIDGTEKLGKEIKEKSGTMAGDTG